MSDFPGKNVGISLHPALYLPFFFVTGKMRHMDASGGRTRYGFLKELLNSASSSVSLLKIKRDSINNKVRRLKTARKIYWTRQQPLSPRRGMPRASGCPGGGAERFGRGAARGSANSSA